MPLCDQTTTRGAPCQKPAMRGATRCAFHLGKQSARETVFSEAIADALVQMLSAGNYIAVAVRAAGISRSTFYNWMELGDSVAPEHEPFRLFRERMDKARAQGEARNVALIAKAATDNWQAAAWMLERQYPDRWGRPSVRMRDEQADEADAVATVEADDLFAEIDELAARRRRHA